MSERDELATIVAEALGDVTGIYDTSRAEDLGIADAILAAGYRKPRTITMAEELDALPVGSVVLSDAYRHYANEMQVSFQRWYDGLWHRGGRSSDTHPDNFLPAILIHEPEPQP